MNISMQQCRICHSAGHLEKIETYKSNWLECSNCQGYVREQKKTYPLEPLASFFRLLGRKGESVADLVGRKKQGVEYYRYYSDILRSGKRGKWDGQFRSVSDQLKQAGIDIEGKRVLDISGEPGFFSRDLLDSGKAAESVVTGFADSVAKAMTDHLKLEGVEFDFQQHDLSKVFTNRKFDIIFVRYAIGFCENLPAFAEQMKAVLASGGVVYISFSPSSRGVCARWMFDDYTYLVQYSRQYFIQTLENAELKLRHEWDEGKFSWNHKVGRLQKWLASWYLDGKFFKDNADESEQKNTALLFSLR